MGWLIVKQSASFIESRRQYRQNTLRPAIVIETYFSCYRRAAFEFGRAGLSVGGFDL
jgi:hypothetical protein